MAESASAASKTASAPDCPALASTTAAAAARTRARFTDGLAVSYVTGGRPTCTVTNAMPFRGDAIHAAKIATRFLFCLFESQVRHMALFVCPPRNLTVSCRPHGPLQTGGGSPFPRRCHSRPPQKGTRCINQLQKGTQDWARLWWRCVMAYHVSRRHGPKSLAHQRMHAWAGKRRHR